MAPTMRPRRSGRTVSFRDESSLSRNSPGSNPGALVTATTAVAVLVLGFFASSASGQSLCPAAEEIAPCTCHEDDANYLVDVDCSAVGYSDQLADIFSTARFPFKKLREFRCVGSTLESLPRGVFGDVKFRVINIADSLVRFVDGDVLVQMADHLEQFLASGNRLHDFPFESIPALQRIDILDLSRNYLERVDQVISNTAAYIYLQENQITTLADNTFSGALALMELKIGSNLFTDLPIGFVDGLSFLYHLDVSNGIVRELKPKSLAFASINVRELWLNDQNIEVVDPEAFEDVLLHTAVHMENNKITELKESAFKPILDSFVQVANSAGFLHLDGNAVVCDCSLKWLAINDNYLRKISGTCTDGTSLSGLNPDVFNNMCK